MWYNNRAVKTTGTKNERTWKILKKTSRNFEKVLDKRKNMWYNSQAVKARLRNHESRKTALHFENWTTKDENKAYYTRKFRNMKILQKSFWSDWKITTENQSKRAKAQTSMIFRVRMWYELFNFFREFDPGSGWTLAACLTHSSRTKHCEWDLRVDFTLTEWRTGE